MLIHCLAKLYCHTTHDVEYAVLDVQHTAPRMAMSNVLAIGVYDVVITDWCTISPIL